MVHLLPDHGADEHLVRVRRAGDAHAGRAGDERRQLERNLEHAERLAAIGRIAAGVPAFIEKLLADWAGPDDRKPILAGLDAIAARSQADYKVAGDKATPAQQDALLPFVESGLVTFIGATTENPSFELNNALLSRARLLYAVLAPNRFAARQGTGPAVLLTARQARMLYPQKTRVPTIPGEEPA